jgi:hypothetical protein
MSVDTDHESAVSEGRRAPFKQLPDAVIDDDQLSPEAKLTYWYLKRIASYTDRRARVSISRLAERMGYSKASKRSARGWVDELTGAGWVDVVHRRSDDGKRHLVSEYIVHETRSDAAANAGGPAVPRDAADEPLGEESGHHWDKHRKGWVPDSPQGRGPAAPTLGAGEPHGSRRCSSLEGSLLPTPSETPDGAADQDANSQEDEPQPLARPDVVQLCNRLRDLMIGNGCKPPTVGKQWETAARLLLDRDKRDLREALWMLGWCQRDEFWRTNVLSMPTFRARYDQLVLRAKAEVGRRRNGLGPVGDASGEPMVPVQVHRGGQRLVPARWFSVTAPPEDWDPSHDPFDRVPGPDLPDWHWRRHNEQ